MRHLPSDPKRLQLLNDAQSERPWRSCTDKRRCMACERIFEGTEVDVRWVHRGVTRLACPGCGSRPGLWVYPGNPLTDDIAWADWEKAMKALEFDESGEAEVA